MVKDISYNGKDKKADMTILILDKIDIKTKIRKKEVFYTMMMGSIQEDNITLASLFSLNIGAPKYINQCYAMLC